MSSSNNEILRRARVEAANRPDYFAQLELSINQTVALAGVLQYAKCLNLPHPGVSTCTSLIERLVSQLREAGLPYHAECIERGYPPLTLRCARRDKWPELDSELYK